MIKDDIENLIQKACQDLQFSVGEISLEHPESMEHGDYSTNVALILAKQLGKNPREIAESIVETINYKLKTINFVEKIEVAGQGFINFFLSKEYLLQELKRIAGAGARLRAAAGGASAWRGKKVVVEFTDPNPFKEFHVGHLYSNIVGEAISRLFEVLGAKVRRANYQGDVGMHVAKAIWGMQQKMKEENISLQELEKKSLHERIEFLSQSYVRGAAAFEKNEEIKKEITELNAKIFAKDKSIQTLYQKGKKWSLDYFETIYRRLGTKFDSYYFESNTAKIGEKIVAEGFEKGIFEKSEGAIIFKGESRGLHSRVFINSQGLPTYEAKELGLALLKYRDFKFDLSLTITGNEVNDYFKVLLYVIELLYPEIGKKMRHIGHGMVRLPEGKMSSRTGNVIAGENLLDEVKSLVLKIMDASGSEVPKNDRKKIAEQITIGAVKYSFLRVSLGKDIIFDFEKSLNLQGDSGPYLQYTYARCQSILRKAKIAGPRNLVSSHLETKFLSKEEMAVLRIFPRFSEIVQEAGEKFSPSLVCNFAFELAQKYNAFYSTNQVLQAETKELKEFRLALTAATAQIIKNSLFLLGIQSPKKM